MSNQRQKTKMKMGPHALSLEKANDFKGTMKKLIAYLKPYHLQFSLVIILIALATSFSIFGPKILGRATTELAEGLMRSLQGTGEINFTKIGEILLFVLAIYIGSLLFNLIQGVIVSDITQKITYQLRQELSTKVDNLPLNFFDQTSNGEVLSIVTNDIETISRSLNQASQQLISSVIMLVGIIIMMLTISWQMTLISLIVVPISVFAAAKIIKVSQKHFIGQQDSLGHVNGHVEEMYGNHLVIKAFNGEEKSIKQFQQYNEQLYTHAWKSQFFSGLLQPITFFISNLGYVLVVIVGGFLAINNQVTIGNIQAFLQYVRSFSQPITQSAQIMSILQATAAAAERIFAFLEADNEPIDCLSPINHQEIKGEVCFENIQFGYTEEIVINNFSTFVKAGEKVAIVGPTGAGKTTLIKLLLRFYELNQGTIYIDGHDTKQFSRHDLRDLFGIVLQDAALFSGSIYENITYGNHQATMDEVIKVCQDTHVDHFVKTLEKGYYTEINEASSNISQGQKQLLTIARALLKDPKILILDEATSSVDTRTEVLIQKAMDKLMENRTSFIIAHRLSTIKNADIILVLDHGDIVEVGNHQQLLDKDGFYAKLYYSQFDEIN